MAKSKMYYFEAQNGKVFYSLCPEYHKDDKQLTQSEGKARYRQQIKDNLMDRLKPVQTVYTLVRSVSSSGMSRKISAFIVEDGQIVDISGYAAIVLDRSRDDRTGGIVCNGAGMDMGFELVYSLGFHLWQQGTPEPHGVRNGVPDSAGGYALKHEWI
jgi:hypothetical protein